MKYRLTNFFYVDSQFASDRHILIDKIYLAPDEIISEPKLEEEATKNAIEHVFNLSEVSENELKVYSILNDRDLVVLSTPKMEKFIYADPKILSLLMKIQERNEGSRFMSATQDEKPFFLVDADNEIMALMMPIVNAGVDEKELKKELEQETKVTSVTIKNKDSQKELERIFPAKKERVEDKIEAFLNGKVEITKEPKPVKKEVSVNDFIKDHVYVINCAPIEKKNKNATKTVASENKIISLEDERINKSLDSLTQLANDFRLIEAKQRQSEICLVK